MSSKILVLANNDGGLYKFRGELMQKLLENNMVVVSIPRGPLVERIREMGCVVINTSVDRRGINPLKDICLFRNYIALLKSEKPDLVITYTIKPNIYGGLVCRMQKIPYAVNITGLGTAFQKKGMLRSLVTAMYKTALKRAKVVFFENSENRQMFIDQKIVKERQACLLHGAGVNLEQFTPAEYPAGNGETRFLFIGRVMKEKGIDELFSAMERLNKQGYRCILEVLGNYEEDYAEKIKKCETDGWLEYYGYQDDVRPFIASAHCFVLPSWHEGMANTNLECAAMARPLITSNISGCREAVIESKSGFLCERQNADSLYEAMKEFLALSYEERRQMGLVGRKHMEQVFDKKKVVEETLARLK